jgi:PAS domain S-box-containing protein
MNNSKKVNGKYNKIGSTIYKELANLLPQTVFEVKLDGQLTFGNLSGLHMFGYDMEDFKSGLNVLDLIIPSEREKAKLDFQHVLKGVKGHGSEYTALRKDTSTFSIIIYASPIFKSGKPVGLRGFLIDNDERKRIEDELKESEHRFRDLAEKSLVGIYLVQDDVFTYVNSTFAGIFGYTIDEMVGILGPVHTAADIDKEKVYDKISKRISNEIESVNYQFKGLTKQKKIIDVEVYGSRTSIKGKPAVIGSLIDVTERKKSEGDLQLLSKRNKLILDTAADGFQILDGCGNTLQVNSAFCEMTGYEENEILQLNINELYVNEENSFNNTLNQVKENKKSSYLFEAKIRRNDNTFIDVEIHANSLCLETEFLFFLSVRNITERISSAQKINQLSMAVEQSPVSIVITDINGTIEYVNSKFCLLTGYSYQEVVGKKPSILKSGKHNLSFYSELWNTIINRLEWNGEIYNRKKNGEYYWEQAKISPIVDKDGQITHFLAVKEDITEKKQTESKLEQAKEKAEELGRLKSSFLANMNHELRTPLIGILGFADILFEELQNPEQKEMANTILDSGKRLLECLNMILDLSRLEADELEFEFVPLNFVSAVRNLFNSYKQAAAHKNLEYILDIKDDKLFSRIDARIFIQIVSNILNNAIKFTKKGSVKIEVLPELVDGKLFNVVKIIDTGIGISKEDQKIIFEEFRQAKEGFNRPFEGTGLGLTITKKFVELMGGNIKLESEQGQGSTFIIRFPSLQKISSEILSESTTEQKEEFSRPRVLSVENDPASVKIIQYFLKNLCVIEHADNGEDALKLLKKNRYNAIMMDINLGPGINGLEAVREIKKFPHCSNIPIIAVTAYALKSDQEKFLKNGCSHYLSKPFDRRVLVELISNILKN